MLNIKKYFERSYKLNRTAFSQACNEILKQIQNISALLVIIVDFSSCSSSSVLHGLFRSEMFHGMVKIKIYRRAHGVFCSLPYLSIEFAEKGTTQQVLSA